MSTAPSRSGDSPVYERDYADEYGYDWTVTFAVDGYQVTVRSDGRISISG